MSAVLLIPLIVAALAPQLFCQSEVTFVYLSPQGVQFDIEGSHRDTDIEYKLEAHVSLNQELQGDRGQYNGEITIARGKPWSFQVQQLKVKYFDTIHYSITVTGTQGRTTWSKTNSGYKQVPVRNPHQGASQYPSNRPQQEVQTQKPTKKPTSTSSGWTSEDVPDPIVEYLNPRGVRVTLPGPHKKSDVYLLKYYVNVNTRFGDVMSGEYNGEVTFPKGRLWTFTVNDLRVSYWDIVYYWVVVQGQTESSTWTEQYRGHWQVPEKDPHENGPSVETVKPPTTTKKPRRTTTTQPPTTTTPRRTTTTQPPTTTTPRRTTTPPRTTTTTQRPTTSTTTQSSTMTTPIPTTTTPIPTTPPPRPTTTTTTWKPQCSLSSTVFNNGERPCARELVAQIFSFNIIEQIGGLEPEDSFTVFLKDCVQSKGERYKSVVPMLLQDKYGVKARDGNLTLDSCTAKVPSLCSASASGFFILPPVLSGRLTTYDNFSFRYGTIEVTAKLPSGDWVVPELWLMPKYNEYGDKSGRITLAMSRGNAQLYDGRHNYGRHVLEVGVQIDNNKQMLYRKEQSRPWCDDFHRFRLVWTPNELRFYVDDVSIGIVSPGPEGLDPSLKGSRLAPFDKEFYLVYGVHVGGDQDFPDTLIGKPWLNLHPKNKVNFWRNQEKWHSTWSSDTALHIRDIRVTAL